MRDMDTENILGYPVTILERDDCINEKGRCLVCANPHSLEQARSDPFFKRAICQADLVTPDGIGVILASRIHGGCIRDRVTGSDIFLGLSYALNQKPGYRYFFLGSTEKTLSLIRDKMSVEFPNIELAGMYSPPFRSEFSSEESQEMVEAVNSAEPHVLWVGMTAPKQEKWIYQHKDQLDVPFIGAVGAVFDFFAGTVNRSPQWFRDRGYEWLPRLIREPKRLWYRNFISFPIFVLRSVVRRLES
jgi:N-acetylglucosaminyldiphosphoundecaprenol N-acetyl-beta-D-mannosaminyltransferase